VPAAPPEGAAARRSSECSRGCEHQNGVGIIGVQPSRSSSAFHARASDSLRDLASNILTLDEVAIDATSSARGVSAFPR
jgi:hypothetical protein